MPKQSGKFSFEDAAVDAVRKFGETTAATVVPRPAVGPPVSTAGFQLGEISRDAGRVAAQWEPDPVAQHLATTFILWKKLQTMDEDIEGGRIFARLAAPHLADNPELQQFFEEHTAEFIAAVETQEALRRVGLDVPLVDKLFAASDEQVASVRHQFAWAQQILADDSAREAMGNDLSVEMLPISDEARLLERFGGDAVARIANISENLSARGLEPVGAQMELAGSLLSRLDGRTLTYARAGDRLVVMVDADSSGESEPYIIDLDLTHDIGGTHLDAVGAVVEALWGTAHTLNHVDEVPGQQTFVGAFNEFMGAVLGPVFRAKDKIDQPVNAAVSVVTTGHPDWRSSDTLVHDDAVAAVESYRRETLPDSDVEIVLALASEMVTSGMSLTRSSYEANEWWDSMTDEQRNRVRDELASGLTAPITDAELEAFKDDRHSVKRIFDQTAETLMSAAQRWDRFAQGNFVTVADFFGDLAQGVAAAFGEEGKQQGLRDAFLGTFEWDGSKVYRGEETAADYFGFDQSSPWYGFMNIGASLAGDPFTWTAASGAVMRQQMMRELSTEAGVDGFLASARGKTFIAPVMEAAEMRAAGNHAPLFALLHRSGLSAEGYRALMAGEDVLSVIRREMVDGNLIPTLTGGFKRRNSAQWVSRVFRAADDGTVEVNRALRYAIGRFGRDRRMSLSSRTFFDDVMDDLLALSTVTKDGEFLLPPDEFNRLVLELVNVTDPKRTGLSKTYTAVRGSQVRAEWNRLGAQRSIHRPTLDAAEGVAAIEERIAAGQLTYSRMGGSSGHQWLDDAYRAAEDAYVQNPTPANRLALDDARAALDGADALARRLELLRDGETLLAQTAATGDAAAVRALEQEIRAAGGALPIDYGTAAWDRRVEEAFAWEAQRRGLRQDMNRLVAMRRHMDLPGSRVELRDFVARLWDNMGVKAGLVDSKGKVDWARATGRAWSVDQPETAGVYDLLAGGNKELAAELRNAGILGDGATWTRPMSPMEFVAYMSRKSDSAWEQTMLRTLYPDMAHRGFVSGLSESVRQAFTFNVLMNPFTWLRSNLDEPLRDLWIRGIRRRADAGERVVGGALAGAARVGDTLFPSQLTDAVGLPTGMSLSDEARRWTNRMTKPFHAKENPLPFVARTREAAGRFSDTTHVPRGEFDRAVNQWISGAMPSSIPGLRAWAQAQVTGGDEFLEWWFEQGGRLKVGLKSSATMNDVGRMSVTGSSRAYDNLLNVLLEDVPVAHRATVRDALLKHWANPEANPLSPFVRRQFSRVPAVESTAGNPLQRMMNGMYDQFFGDPAQLHQGLIFEDFFDQALSVLKARHSGRILDADTMRRLSGGKYTLEQAELMLARSAPEVAEYAAQHGLVTVKMLEHDAARVASTHAEHMAYSMGASTMMGEKLTRMFPFLKAQVDFLGFWGTELTQGTSLMLHPALQKLLRSVGGGRLVDEAVPFFGRAVKVPHFPLNMRLATRMADYFGAVSNTDDSDYFQSFMDNYTFLPTGEEDIWMSLAPGMTPLPSWALHMLPMDSPIRNLLSAVDPAFDFYDGQARPWDVLDFVLPDSKHSLRRLGESVLRGLGIGTGTAGVVDHFVAAPPGFHTYERFAIGELLKRNPHRSSADGGWKDDAQAATDDAYMRAVKGDLGQTINEFALRAGGFLLDADDGQYLNLYESLVSEIGSLYQGGLVSDEQFDTVSRLWAKWENGTASYDEAQQLGDALSGVLFGIPDWAQALMVLKHPELAGNLISQWRVTEDAPVEYTNGDRLVAPPGQAGRDLRERAKAEGWLVLRDPSTMPDMALLRYAQSFREARNTVWTSLTSYDRWTTNVAASKRGNKVVLDDYAVSVLEALNIDPSTIETWGDLNDAFAQLSDVHAANMYPLSGDAVSGNIAARQQALANVTINGRQKASAKVPVWDHAAWYGAWQKYAEDMKADPDNPDTWPADAVDAIREGYQWAIDVGLLDSRDYERLLAPRFGSLDYAVPEPPALSSVPIGRTDDTYRLSVDPGDLTVLDGDTVRIHFSDDSSRRVRLIGVNAAEKNQWETQRAVDAGGVPAWLEQTERLERLLASGAQIDFVVFDKDRFPVSDTVGGDEVRYYMWLYVDGVPVYDPDVFSPTNPSGAGLGGNGVPVEFVE